jgi:hypothetical protein
LYTLGSFFTISGIYAGVHLALWNYDFPTKVERLLWRLASCALGAPFAFFCATVALFIGIMLLIWITSSKVTIKRKTARLQRQLPRNNELNDVLPSNKLTVNEMQTFTEQPELLETTQPITTQQGSLNADQEPAQTDVQPSNLAQMQTQTGFELGETNYKALATGACLLEARTMPFGPGLEADGTSQVPQAQETVDSGDHICDPTSPAMDATSSRSSSVFRSRGHYLFNLFLRIIARSERAQIVFTVVAVAISLPLSVVCITAAILYMLSRLFIVVEAFVSLRRVPIEVYETVTWAQYIPHI